MRRRLALAGVAVLATAAALAACAPIDDPSQVVATGADEAREAVVENPAAHVREPVKEVGEVESLNATTTTVGYTLPTPEPLPLDPYEPTAEQTVGSIAIPAIGLDEALHVGMTLTAINRGPSMWPGTALPGEVGNLVVAGHRTTYGAPFRDLDQLQPGDQVVFTSDAGTFTYEVDGTQIVDPEAVDIANQSNDHRATLFACHPPGSAAQRIVVTMDLLGPDGEPVPRAT
jgi:sortase A